MKNDRRAAAEGGSDRTAKGGQGRANGKGNGHLPGRASSNRPRAGQGWTGNGQDYGAKSDSGPGHVGPLAEITEEFLQHLIRVSGWSASRVTRNRYVIDEAAEQTIVALVARVDAGERIRSLEAWCRGTAWKLAVKLSRREARRVPMPAGEPSRTPEPGESPDAEPWIGERLAWSVSRDVVESFLDPIRALLSPRLGDALDALRASASWKAACIRARMHPANLHRAFRLIVATARTLRLRAVVDNVVGLVG